MAAVTQYAFQDRSVRKLSDMLKTQHAAMLGHDPGLGKTIIAIRVADELNLRRILVVTTVSSLYNWQREIHKFGQIMRTVKVVTDTHVCVDELKDFDVIVMAYSQLSGVTRTLEAVTAQVRDLVIFDEAHALKTMGTKRTDAAYFGVEAKDGMHLESLDDCALHTLSMSGTFTSNHYGELYPHLRALIPDTLRAENIPDYDTFLNRFCVVRQGPYGPSVIGNKNVSELRELLRPVFHRFSRKRVLPDLPALVIEEKLLPLSVNVAVANEALETALEGNPFHEAEENDIPVSTARRELGLAKVPDVVGFVNDELSNSTDKMILFAHHRDVLRLLEQQLQSFNPVLVMGGMSAHEMDRATQRFQNDTHCRLFLGQIDAAGEAITLTAANRVAFAEFSWDPGKNYQAIMRAHRIGQANSVLAQFLVVEGSLDEAMGRVVARKTKMTADLFG